jgi:hypothetical protein
MHNHLSCFKAPSQGYFQRAQKVDNEAAKEQGWKLVCRCAYLARIIHSRRIDSETWKIIRNAPSASFYGSPSNRY